MNLDNIAVFQNFFNDSELLAGKFSGFAPDSGELELSYEITMNMLADSL
jgi:hypothetical protein